MNHLKKNTNCTAKKYIYPFFSTVLSHSSFFLRVPLAPGAAAPTTAPPLPAPARPRQRDPSSPLAGQGPAAEEASGSQWRPLRRWTRWTRTRGGGGPSGGLGKEGPSSLSRLTTTTTTTMTTRVRRRSGRQGRTWKKIRKMVRNIKSLYSDKFVFNVPLFSIAASSPDGSVDGPPSPTSSSPTTTTTNAGGQGSPGQGGIVLGGVGFSDGTLPTPTIKPRDPFKRRPILRPPRPSFATGGGDNGNTDAPIGGPIRRPSFPPRPPPKTRPFR